MPRHSKAKSSTNKTSADGTPLNDILSKLSNAKYLSLIDANSGYNNLELDERSSYLMMFTCQFGRYRYKSLPFGAAPAGDMFQKKIDKICMWDC